MDILRVGIPHCRRNDRRASETKKIDSQRGEQLFIEEALLSSRGCRPGAGIFPVGGAGQVRRRRYHPLFVMVKILQQSMERNRWMKSSYRRVPSITARIPFLAYFHMNRPNILREVNQTQRKLHEGDLFAEPEPISI